MIPNPRNIKKGRWLGLWLAAAALATPQVSSGQDLELAPCHLDGLAEQVLCGTFEVFEDRLSQSGRTLDLRVAVLPARRQPAAPDPLFLLAGGPGQSAVDLASFARRVFDEVHRHRDLVLVDVRGTGGSNPLGCPEVDILYAAEALADDPRACFETLDADTRFYTTELAMADLDDVRRALGYERINLWGGSYGTRAALVYLKLFGENVRAAVLDSIAPFTNKVPLFYARDGQRVLDLLIDDCQRDVTCNAAFPDLAAQLEELLERLDAEPVRVVASHPRTAQPVEVMIDRTFFAGNLRNFLYSTRYQAMVPHLVERAAAGDWRPLLAAGPEFLDGMMQSVDVGMTYSVLCAEEVPRISDAEIEEATSGSFLGSMVMDLWRDICAVWPHGEGPAWLEEPFESDVPALLLSGRLDPVTPPSWGKSLAATMPGALHVEVPGTAHIASAQPCIDDLIARFLDAGSAAGLDASCVEKIARPPFVTGPYGTEP